MTERLLPVVGGRFPTSGTRGYGATRGPTEREPSGHVHAGVDIGGSSGTNVRAPEAGVVELAQTSGPGWTGYEPCVLIRGDSGVWHLLAHLSGGIAVMTGARVAAGDVVGRIGRERHVHWEVRNRAHERTGDLPLSVTIDPSIWLAGGESSAAPFPRALPSRSARPCRAPGREASPRRPSSRSFYSGRDVGGES